MVLFDLSSSPPATDTLIGMFLWVRLIVEELQYCYSDVALEERVLSLPKGLHEA